ncbi:tripartite tricarboxylate transporter substrate binding protein BugE [Variovorax defluvii]|uniref:Tripartite tricarboxylate transporter substrate binding protein BugE n=1 Tax=Variovorax defluvii TaxID=913761 RepID=A0ABP8I8T8_9BURK
MSVPSLSASRLTRRAFAAVAALGAARIAFAAYPERPITVSLPFGAGVAIEVTIRMVCEEAGKILGQPVVVENRSGALQRLPALAVRRATPDGYTLGVGTDSVHVAQPVIDPTFTMRPNKDFEPVAALISLPLVIVSNPSVSFRDIKGLVAYAKANPGKINFAVPTGSTAHFAALLLQEITGTNMSIVPYKDQASSLPDLMSGRVDLTISGATVKTSVESGKLNALAVTIANRWSAFPAVPTLKELGYDVDVAAWFTLLAPPGTPADVVARINSAFNQAMQSPVVRRRLGEVNMTDLGNNMSPKQIVSMIDSEVKLWTPVLQKSGVKFQ